jgi:hypothetical protein
MPDPQDIEKLYSPAKQINEALATIFTLAGLTAYHPNSAPVLQKARARIEINTQVGAEHQSYHTFSDGSKRNAAWTGQIEFSIIAPTTSADGAESLSQIQAVFAWCMSNIAADLNGNDSSGNAYLPYHEIQRITGNALAQSFPYEDGYLMAKPVYALEFGIDGGAWVELGLTRI